MRFTSISAALVVLGALCVSPCLDTNLSAGPNDGVAPAASSRPNQASSQAASACATAIDGCIDRGLRERGIPASPPADDAEFLRRVYLDLVGRIPNRQQVSAFLDSKEPNRRPKLIDDLLASAAYAEHFATIWRNLIVPREEGAKDKPIRDFFSDWLAEQFLKNRGWNEIVKDMLVAEGQVAKVPQTEFLMANSDNFQPQPSRLTDATGRLFWGIQLRCAECHDHPFAQWKQNDFWSTAAFFSRVRHTGFRTKTPSVTEMVDPAAKVAPLPGAALKIAASAGKSAGNVVRARYLGGAEADLGQDGPFRPAFAAWATGSDHPYFAAAAVNRWWGHFFGRGLVQPVDGFDEGNPPSHPEVLEHLRREFVASGFDLKHLCRCICNTRAYQRSSRPLAENEKDERGLSHMAVKALSPEEFYRSVAVVMGVDPKTGKGQGLALEPRQTFVRSFRPLPDTGAVDGYAQGIPQFLKLLNAPLLHQKAPIVETLARSNKSPAEAIAALFLTALSRRPSAEEVTLMAEYVAAQPSPRDAFAGVLWILLNSSEFALNR
jgi:hypothetical protein